MENQPTNRPSRRKNAQPPRGTAGETSKKASTSRSTVQKPPVVPTPETVPAPVPTTLTTTAVVPPPPEVVKSAPTTTVAPTAMVNPTMPAVIPASTTVTPSDDAETERLVREMLKTMKASELFARMSEALKREEAASQLTLLEIPPRPQTLVETPTSQTLAALKENPQITPETLTQEMPPTAQITHTKAQPSTETLVGRGEETQARDGQVGDDAPSTRAGEGEGKSMSEGEEGRKGEEAETTEDRESEGEDKHGEVGGGRELVQVSVKLVRLFARSSS